MLVKKSFITKFFFDTNIPRLQDFDLILRMIPKVKISYSKYTLVELHIQKDSVTLSQKKLKKAIDILLKKKFHFNAKQNKLFFNYLNQTLYRLPKKIRKSNI